VEDVALVWAVRNGAAESARALKKAMILIRYLLMMMSFV
jgi:hypothetical protein